MCVVVWYIFGGHAIETTQTADGVGVNETALNFSHNRRIFLSYKINFLILFSLTFEFDQILVENLYIFFTLKLIWTNRQEMCWFLFSISIFQFGSKFSVYWNKDYFFFVCSVRENHFGICLMWNVCTRACVTFYVCVSCGKVVNKGACLRHIVIVYGWYVGVTIEMNECLLYTHRYDAWYAWRVEIFFFFIQRWTATHTLLFCHPNQPGGLPAKYGIFWIQLEGHTRKPPNSLNGWNKKKSMCYE